MSPSAAQKMRATRGALLRYRVMAYVTGVGLVILVLVAVPLRYLGHSPGLATVVGTLHGFLYIVYLLATLDLGIRVRWRLDRLVLVMLAGTVPFLSFVAERKVSAQLERDGRV